MSTHYYVISLSEHENALYEAFRDDVIDIRNGGFPVEVSLRASSAADSIDREERLREALRIVDQLFGDCYRHDPLGVVVTGKKELLDLFASVTAHRSVIVGRIEGDYSTTSLHDLGKIVWPIVKEAISGLLDEAMRDLEIAEKAGRTACGLDAVSQLAIAGVSATLIVEDDYHMRGSITRTSQSLEISQEVDVMEELDDAVDVVIEKVLESGGNVVFAPSGSLHRQGRIVLLLRESEGLQ
ncbi:MAG: hypothetical protein GTO51_09750 [Candidatus Latescibacteria bacterium]|nr:hypothetical protein [Candidatus Latescibacterota bacterium]NIM22213.1 hypothetical protein [Candidatus Latescibacterota bacterium]NIM66252.1 hypothetical protein [Candidatus Latescibacterota bacterium]NIO78417.1 hypothetical protein [Candidatus Latescibacterota bacterium]NIT03186.1 hypothetical protein [Candidatus Latescibacterota bacterium]